MGHVHTKSNSYALTRVTDQIICMSMSGVCLECRLRIQPKVFSLNNILLFLLGWIWSIVWRVSFITISGIYSFFLSLNNITLGYVFSPLLQFEPTFYNSFSFGYGAYSW